MMDLVPPKARLLDGLMLLRNRHFLLLDLLVICASPVLALILRTDRLSSLETYAGPLLVYTAFSVLLKLSIFYKAGLYRRMWRFASMDELILIGAVSVVSTTVALLAILFLNIYWMPSSQSLPRSIPIVDGILVFLFVGSIRFSIRLADAWQLPKIGKNRARVAIVGAGAAGNLCYREIQRNPEMGLEVVGFFDDDPLKAKARVHGTTILGNRRTIPRVVKEYGIDQIIIAMPSVPGKEIRDIVKICEQLPIEVKTMPSISEIINSGFTIDAVRQVQIEDLLRREPVQTDFDKVRAMLGGKNILITGGGGSIGGELCRQILTCNPAKLIILGHGENSVFEINRELRTLVSEHFASESAPQIETVIADIRFAERLHHLFRRHKPDIVFHAAAHKHVPLMEQHPTEAVDNNILGTRNVLAASVAAGVQRFVMISSDKAVNPTNVMGASKRCAELLVHQTAAKTGLPYVAVRFGNVLGSRGSVLLTFKDQIASGGPITVTHPDMLRFFMTIPEAVQLVLQAGALGSGGEVFMLDMGEPVKIDRLAHDLIELCGLEVGGDIDVVYSGIRPGEKLFEELFIEGEQYGRTAHDKILTVGNAGKFVPHDLDEMIDALQAASHRYDNEAIIRLLGILVPEYDPGQKTEVAEPDQQSPKVTAEKQLVTLMT